MIKSVVQILLELWEAWSCDTPGEPVTVAGHLFSEEAFHNAQCEFTLMQCHSILCPVTGHQRSTSAPPFLLLYSRRCHEVTPQLSLSWPKQATSDAPLVLENLHHLDCLPQTPSNSLMSFWYRGTQNCTQDLTWGCISALQSRTVTFLEQLVMLCLKANAPQDTADPFCWPIFNFPSTQSSRFLSGIQPFSPFVHTSCVPHHR